jgi:hypothetical protein
MEFGFEGVGNLCYVRSAGLTLILCTFCQGYLITLYSIPLLKLMIVDVNGLFGSSLREGSLQFGIAEVAAG